MLAIALGLGVSLAYGQATDGEIDKPEPQAMEESGLGESPSVESDGSNTAFDEDQPPEEVVVWGDQHVRQARAVVIRSMEQLGWSARARRRDESVVFRPPQAWMGKAFLDPDGTLRFGRPIVAAEPALVPGNHSEYDAGRVLNRMDTSGIAGGASTMILPSKSKLASVHSDVRARMSDCLAAYVNVYRETQFRQLEFDLPARLDALMTDGAAINGSSRVFETVAERRVAVLAYWSELNDGQDGERLSEVVEAWIREVIQRSSEPLSPAEIRAAEAGREDGRRLNLGRD